MTLTRCPHCNEPIELAKPRGPQPKYDHDMARALLKFGATPTEIAEVMGVTPQAISALKRNGAAA